MSLGDFETNSAIAVKQALSGEEMVDTIRVGERLFDIVSVPVLGLSGGVVGAITFGTEIGEAVAREFSSVSRSQIAFLANGRVIASTVPGADTQAEFSSLFSECAAGAPHLDKPGGIKKVRLGEEHYFCSAGQFTSASGDTGLGYLLLCFYIVPSNI